MAKVRCVHLANKIQHFPNQRDWIGFILAIRVAAAVLPNKVYLGTKKSFKPFESLLYLCTNSTGLKTWERQDNFVYRYPNGNELNKVFYYTGNDRSESELFNELYTSQGGNVARKPFCKARTLNVRFNAHRKNEPLLYCIVFQ